MTSDQGFTDNAYRWRGAGRVVPLDTALVLSLIALCMGIVIGANAW